MLTFTVHRSFHQNKMFNNDAKMMFLMECPVKYCTVPTVPFFAQIVCLNVTLTSILMWSVALRP